MRINELVTKDCVTNIYINLNSATRTRRREEEDGGKMSTICRIVRPISVWIIEKKKNARQKV